MNNRAGQSSREIGYGDKEEPQSKPAKDNQADECSSLTSGAGSQNNRVSYQPEKNLNIENFLAGGENVGNVASGGDTTSNVNNDSSQGDQGRQSDQEDSSTQSIPESVALGSARELEDGIMGNKVSPTELVNSLGNLREQSFTSGGKEND